MLIVSNWKAYVESLDRAKKLFALNKKFSAKIGDRFVIAPPAPFLSKLAIGNRSKVAFSAQDVSVSLGGATTGEVTASMYAASGADYTIIGHSERRTMGDTDAVVAQKMSRALAQGLTPILCVGEHERDSEGRYLARVREEITTALAPLTTKERSQVIIAYEPLWAIGKSATSAIAPHDLAEMVLYIRKVLSEMLPGKSSQHALVLYGGSVEAANIRDLARGSGIDGFLIGHASADEHAFPALVKQLS